MKNQNLRVENFVKNSVSKFQCFDLYGINEIPANTERDST